MPRPAAIPPPAIGQRFGMLAIIAVAGKDRHGTKYLCACDCASQTMAYGFNLQSGHTQSCGCLRLGESSNLTGAHFGRWTVLDPVPDPKKRGCLKYICRCDCGVERLIRASRLIAGTSMSCGCLQRELTSARATKHGHASNGQRTPEYRAWESMRERCLNPQHRAWKDYGGRGIGIEEPSWDQFSNFYADLGPKPAPGYSLDRINNDKGYCKENCRWADRKTQRANQRKGRPRNAKVTARQATEIRVLRAHSSRAEIAARFDISKSAIDRILTGKTWREAK